MGESREWWSFAGFELGGEGFDDFVEDCDWCESILDVLGDGVFPKGMWRGRLGWHGGPGRCVLVFFDEGIAVLFGGGDDDGICAVLVDSTDENVSGLFCFLLSLKSVSCVGSFSGTVFDKGGDCGVAGGFEVLGDGYGVLHNWDGVSDLSFVEEAGCVLDKCGYLCVWRRIGRGIRLEDDDLGGRDGLEELDVVWEVEYRWEWYIWV